MKRLLSVILSAVMIVSLCACAKTPQTPVEAEKKDLTELDTTSLGEINLISIDSDESRSVLFYTNYVEEYPQYEGAEVEDCYYLSVFDNNKNKLIKTIEFENKNCDGYNVAIDENGISLFNMLNSEKITYDLSLENREVGTYDYQDSYKFAQSIASIDENRFECREGFALSSSYGVSKAVVFYDNTEKVYMIDENVYYDYNRVLGHKFLVIDNSANVTDKPESVVRILDFDNQTEINTLKIPNNEEYNNVQHTAFNDKVITISTVKGEGRLDKIYVWDYLQNEKSNPFEYSYFEALEVDGLEQSIKEVCNRIKENTGVSVECPAEKEFIRQEFEYSNDVNMIITYQSVLDLEAYLSYFPKELYQEITCKDVENSISVFDDFKIYMVGDFPNDDVDAFASNISCDETNNEEIVYIAYSILHFNQKNFFHEIMHALEYRIWNYENDFEEKWEKLNPKGFEYTEDYGNQYYEEGKEAWQDYFTRDYGMKNTLEDRATCFEELCDGALTDSLWWKEKPPLLAKEKYLAEVLQKSFPSLSDGSLWKKALQ